MAVPAIEIGMKTVVEITRGSDGDTSSRKT